MLTLLRHIGNRTRLWIVAMVVILAMLLTGCASLIEAPSSTAESSPSPIASEIGRVPSSAPAPLTGFKEVSDYIRLHHGLPDNFLTKKEAEALGWVPSKGNLHKVAPGKSIGGDRFGNREGLLPKAKGRVWYEADINYEQGTRGADRILYSSDGLIYMTTDHYKSFTDITKEGSVSE